MTANAVGYKIDIFFNIKIVLASGITMSVGE